MESISMEQLLKEHKAITILKSIGGIIRVYETIGGKFILECQHDDVGLMREDYESLKEVFENA